MSEGAEVGRELDASERRRDLRVGLIQRRLWPRRARSLGSTRVRATTDQQQGLDDRGVADKDAADFVTTVWPSFCACISLSGTTGFRRSPPCSVDLSAICPAKRGPIVPGPDRAGRLGSAAQRRVPEGGWGDLASSAKSCSARSCQRISCLTRRGRFCPPPLVGLLPRSRGETPGAGSGTAFRPSR